MLSRFSAVVSLRSMTVTSRRGARMHRNDHVGSRGFGGLEFDLELWFGGRAANIDREGIKKWAFLQITHRLTRIYLNPTPLMSETPNPGDHMNPKRRVIYPLLLDARRRYKP